MKVYGTQKTMPLSFERIKGTVYIRENITEVIDESGLKCYCYDEEQILEEDYDKKESE